MYQEPSDDNELNEFISDILESRSFDTQQEKVAEGIARKVLHDGFESLSAKQRAAFEKVFSPLLRAEQTKIDKSRAANLMRRDTPP